MLGAHVRPCGNVGCHGANCMAWVAPCGIPRCCWAHCQKLFLNKKIFFYFEVTYLNWTNNLRLQDSSSLGRHGLLLIAYCNTLLLVIPNFESISSPVCFVHHLNNKLSIRIVNPKLLNTFCTSCFCCCCCCCCCWGCC